MAKRAAAYLLIFGAIAPCLGAFLFTFFSYLYAAEDSYSVWEAAYAAFFAAIIGFIVFFPIWFLLAFSGYLILDWLNAKFDKTILLNSTVFGVILGCSVGLVFSFLFHTAQMLGVLPLIGAGVGALCGISFFYCIRASE